MGEIGNAMVRKNRKSQDVWTCPHCGEVFEIVWINKYTARLSASTMFTISSDCYSEWLHSIFKEWQNEG